MGRKTKAASDLDFRLTLDDFLLLDPSYTDADPRPVHDPPCPVCGQGLLAHPRCRCCTILVGPKHVEEELTRAGLCLSCAGWLHDHPPRRRRAHGREPTQQNSDSVASS